MTLVGRLIACSFIRPLLLLCVALWAWVAPAQGQGQWQWLNPHPNAQAGHVVRFVDASHGFILQSTGTLLRTQDAGQRWEEFFRVEGAVDLDFSADGVGYILSQPGVLWRSPDRGQNWERVSAAPQTPAYSYYGPVLQRAYTRVHVISADTLFEVAADGFIRRSVNGGRAWQAYPSGVTRVLSSYFVSGQIGFLGTTGGQIYKTTTGGATWTRLSSVSYIPSEITMLHFRNARVGFAHREHSDLLRTTDGGLTWTVVSSRLEDIADMHFLSDQVGFAVGDYGVTYSTTDGGLTWTWKNPTGLIDGNYWRSVYFTSPSTGYVTGTSNAGPILRTVDGGQTWLPLGPFMGTVLDLIFPGHGLLGYALTTRGVLKTLDGGTTWAQLPFTGTGNKMVCPDAQTVLIAGNACQVHRSADGGQTWTTTALVPPPSYTSVRLKALTMADSQVGYVSGDYNGLDQILARTGDGGRTWQRMTNATNTGWRQLHFVTASTGFGIRYGDLYTTRDAGQSWQPVSLQHNNSVNEVHFVTAQVGYAIDDSGYIHKTTNGGTSWVAISINQSSPYAMGHPQHVQFRDPDTGCVQDDAGNVFRTSDGGATWLWERNLASQAIGYTHDGQSLVIGGRNGMIVRRSLVTSSLPFQARVLPPVTLPNGSAVLRGLLRSRTSTLDSVRYEYAAVSQPGYRHGQVVLASPVPWYGGDSVQGRIEWGLLAATTYRVRLRFRHNGIRYYSADTTFTTPASLPLASVGGTVPTLTAYPNPTRGYVRVISPTASPARLMELFSLQGIRVRQTQEGRGIDLTGLPNGLYLLQVHDGEHVYRQRIQKIE